MARDYSGSRNRRSKTSANGKRKPARRSAQRRKTPKKNVRRQPATPSWVWLLSGLCLGLTVAAFVYIATRPTSEPGAGATAVAVPQPNGDSADAQDATVVAEDEQANEESRFAFYEMLPDYEVVIPQEEYTDQPAAAPAAPEPAETKPKPTTPSVERSGRYIIQAGSFSTREDANRRKAELTLMGVQAVVSQVQLDSGKTVYRVRSRTIDSNNRLTEVLKRLHEQDINTVVLRQSD